LNAYRVGETIKKNFSNKEIKETFKLLGLSSREERQKWLTQNFEFLKAENNFVTHILLDNRAFSKTEGVKNAELE